MCLAVGENGWVVQVHSDVNILEAFAQDERAEDVGELDFGSFAEKFLEQSYDVGLGKHFTTMCLRELNVSKGEAATVA